MSVADLDGQVATVTGGGSGIGAALCRRLAARGASVVVADIDSDGANAVATGIDGVALALDVSRRDAWEASMTTVVERFGRLDCIALNAGVMSRPRAAPTTDDPLPWIDRRYELLRGVNVDGVVFGIAQGLEMVLDQPPSETGGVWISREGHAPWRHEFISPDHPGIR